MPDADLTPFLGISRISSPSSSLEGMIDLWVHGKSPHTQRYYRREAQKFLAMVAKPLELVTLADVQAYVTVLGVIVALERRAQLRRSMLVQKGNQL